MADARVAELWRYPVKSMRGERLETAELEREGIRGDRLLRVERDGRLITARTGRGLLSIDPSAGAPEAQLERAVPGAELVSTADGGRFDEMPIQLLGAATATEFGADHRRFRPNIVVAGIAAAEEDGWVGRQIRVGDVVLRADHRCERCVVTTIDPDTLELDTSVLERLHSEKESRFGVLCEVVVTGTIRVGDPVVPL